MADVVSLCQAGGDDLTVLREVSAGNEAVIAGDKPQWFSQLLVSRPLSLGKRKGSQRAFVYVQYQRLIFTVLEIKSYQMLNNKNIFSSLFTICLFP